MSYLTQSLGEMKDLTRTCMIMQDPMQDFH